MTDSRNKARNKRYNKTYTKNTYKKPKTYQNISNNDKSIIIKNRNDKDRLIKDAIFAFTGGKKALLIKGEGSEISTAVEVAEIIKNRMYPSIEVANISLGSRPYYQKFNKKNNNKKSNDIVSNIEILLKTT
ncbi:MAG: hypothetical protein ACFFBP_01790 [Promethearchaeota archaeon]